MQSECDVHAFIYLLLSSLLIVRKTLSFTFNLSQEAFLSPSYAFKFEGKKHDNYVIFISVIFIILINNTSHMFISIMHYYNAWYLTSAFAPEKKICLMIANLIIKKIKVNKLHRMNENIYDLIKRV